MADDNIFNPKKIIEKLRAQGFSDADIAKTLGVDQKSLPKASAQIPNSAKVNAHRKANAWKYDNKHVRPERQEDIDPDYEPIEELRKKSGPTKKPPNPRITRKKPKPKPKKVEWTPAAEERLKMLVEAKYPVKDIATEFKTTVDAITGKISRLKQAGWRPGEKPHAPLPSSNIPPPSSNPSSSSSPKGSRFTSDQKKFLSGVLERNLGVAGKYLAKKWGLYESKINISGGGGSTKEVSDSVVKANQMIVNSLTKLDLALRRSTSSLTKTINLSTSKMTDGIRNVTDNFKKQEVAEKLEGGSGTSATAAGKGSAGGGLGLLAGLLGGAALASLLRPEAAEASTSFNDDIGPDKPDINDVGNNTAPGPDDDNDDSTKDIKFKVKELNFEAEDITFEANQYKFKTKNISGGAQSSISGKTPVPAPGTPVGTPAISGGSGVSGPGGTTGGTGAAGAGAAGGAGGGAGSGGKGFFGGLMDKLATGFGLGGMGGEGSTGGGGAAGAGGGGGTYLPSDGDMKKLNDEWFSGKSHNNNSRPGGGKGGGSGGPNQSPTSSDNTTSQPSGTLAEQRAKFNDELNDPSLRENILAMASAEEGNNSTDRKSVMETMFNRATAHGNSLGSTVGNQAYYAPYQDGHYAEHLSKIRNDPNYKAQLEKELDEVRKGSNFSNYATHNGSAGVADSARQTQTIGRDSPSGEVFSRKDRPEFSGLHGQGTTQMEGDWYRNTIKADQAAVSDNYNPSKGNEIPTEGNGGDPQKQYEMTGKMRGSDYAADPSNPGAWYQDYKKALQDDDADQTDSSSKSGAALTDTQKQMDTDTKPTSDKRSDLSPSPGTLPDSSDTVQTALLPTQGPDHFDDFPMSDQGVGA